MYDVPEKVAGRRAAAGKITNDRVRQIMLGQPLPKLSTVYTELFERLAGEDIAEFDQVHLAASTIRSAKENGLPILMVIYKSDAMKSKSRTYYDSLRRTLKHPKLNRIRTGYRFVSLKLDEYPALSGQVEIPLHDVSRNNELTIFVLNSDATRAAKFGSLPSPEQLADAMTPPLISSLTQRASGYDALGNASGARDTYRRVLRLATNDPLRKEIQKKMESLTSSRQASKLLNPGKTNDSEKQPPGQSRLIRKR